MLNVALNGRKEWGLFIVAVLLLAVGNIFMAFMFFHQHVREEAHPSQRLYIDQLDRFYDMKLLLLSLDDYNDLAGPEMMPCFVWELTDQYGRMQNVTRQCQWPPVWPYSPSGLRSSNGSKYLSSQRRLNGWWTKCKRVIATTRGDWNTIVGDWNKLCYWTVFPVPLTFTVDKSNGATNVRHRQAKPQDLCSYGTWNYSDGQTGWANCWGDCGGRVPKAPNGTEVPSWGKSCRGRALPDFQQDLTWVPDWDSDYLYDHVEQLEARTSIPYLRACPATECMDPKTQKEDPACSETFQIPSSNNPLPDVFVVPYVDLQDVKWKPLVDEAARRCHTDTGVMVTNIIVQGWDASCLSTFFPDGTTWTSDIEISSYRTKDLRDGSERHVLKARSLNTIQKASSVLSVKGQGKHLQVNFAEQVVEKYVSFTWGNAISAYLSVLNFSVFLFGLLFRRKLIVPLYFCWGSQRDHFNWPMPSLDHPQSRDVEINSELSHTQLTPTP